MIDATGNELTITLTGMDVDEQPKELLTVTPYTPVLETVID